jgi:DNA (cytosine-5)-methyltransferase 1
MCLNAGGMGRQDVETETLISTNGGHFGVAHSLRGEGFDASEDGTGRGTPLVVGSICAHSFVGGPSGRPEGASQGHFVTVGAVFEYMQVRRLTPRECERLQGFPDNFTAIPWRGKPAADCPDGPRYKALGNSMAVPVMRWIGERIQGVQQ